LGYVLRRAPLGFDNTAAIAIARCSKASTSSVVTLCAAAAREFGRA
jgi:hypothetical protein